MGRLGQLAPSHTARSRHPVSVLPLLMAPVAVGQVDRAEVGDAGRYTCEALNQAGRSEKHYNLNVWGEGLSGWAAVPPPFPYAASSHAPGDCCLDWVPGCSPVPSQPTTPSHPLFSQSLQCSPRGSPAT